MLTWVGQVNIGNHNFFVLFIRGSLVVVYCEGIRILGKFPGLVSTRSVEDVLKAGASSSRCVFRHPVETTLPTASVFRIASHRLSALVISLVFNDILV